MGPKMLSNSGRKKLLVLSEENVSEEEIAIRMTQIAAGIQALSSTRRRLLNMRTCAYSA